MIENSIKIAIYIHAFFGGLGLITGIGSAIVKKGSKLHKKMGKLFSIGMLTSSIISLPIACMPKHENPFLFSISLFTIYLVLAGNRALTFKPKLKEKATITDKLISGSMLVISIIMVLFGVLGFIQKINNNILYLFFGSFGLLLTIKDFSFFKKYKEQKNAWLRNHISKISGALIASITAFIVAGLGIGNLISWTLPSIIGSFYIAYWSRKYKPKKKES